MAKRRRPAQPPKTDDSEILADLSSARAHAEPLHNAENQEDFADLDSYCEGGWITAVSGLVRWLKSNDCNEYAQPLSWEIRPFHNLPTDRRRELKGLQRISLSLHHLGQEPPSDLDRKKRKTLARLVDNATKLVQYRLRQLPTLIDGEVKAKNNVKALLDKNDLSDVDNDRESNFLEALFVLGAFDTESRAALPEIVKKAEGPAANSQSFKQMATNLRHKGFTHSRGGRNGGYWLTERGKAYVESKRKV